MKRTVTTNLIASGNSKRQATYYSGDEFSILFTKDFTDINSKQRLPLIMIGLILHWFILP